MAPASSFPEEMEVEVRVWGWGCQLVLVKGEVFPRLYRKRSRHWKWITWGIGETEWEWINQQLYQGEVIEMELTTIRKLLELYRFATSNGLRQWNWLDVLYPISQKDCPQVNLWWDGHTLHWKVAE